MPKKTTKKKTKSTKKTKKKNTVRKKTSNRATGTDESALVIRKKRARSVLRVLRRLYGDADCALTHKNAFELTIATILSAQSTDANVNKATPALFKRFGTAKKLANANPLEVEELVRSTGFFRQKAKNIIGCARKIVDEFQGQVPQTIEELTTLPGVARKTANVVLGTWFGKNEGVVVDTHVGRISDRLELVWGHKNTKDAVKIERALQQVLPRKDWTYYSHAIIWHGRAVCKAIRPDCENCDILKWCPTGSAGRD